MKKPRIRLKCEDNWIENRLQVIERLTTKKKPRNIGKKMRWAWNVSRNKETKMKSWLELWMHSIIPKLFRLNLTKNGPIEKRYWRSATGPGFQGLFAQLAKRLSLKPMFQSTTVEKWIWFPINVAPSISKEKLLETKPVPNGWPQDPAASPDSQIIYGSMIFGPPDRWPLAMPAWFFPSLYGSLC